MRNRFLKFFLLAVIAAIVVWILYYPLFDPLPNFKRYLSFDFLMSSWTQLNYFLGTYNVQQLSISHWNQYAAVGSPSIVSVGIYYLPNYLLKFFYTSGGGYLNLMTFQVFLLAHMVVAAIGMYLFLYSKVTVKWLASFGSVMLLVSGYMMESNWVEYIIAIALLPWILICIEKYFKEKKILWFFLASFLSFQQFMINPQIFFYTMIFVMLYIFIDGFDWERVKKMLLFFTCTALYSAIYLLPAQEFSQFSVRNNILNSDYVGAMVTKAGSIFQFAVNFGDTHLYLGSVSLIVIVAFLAGTSKKRDYRLLLIAILLFIFSTNTALIGMITHLVPGLSLLRWQSRMLELVVFVLILVIVRALDRYKFDFKRDLKIALSVGAVVILTYVIFLRNDSKNFENNLEQVSYSVLFIMAFCFVLFGRKKGYITDNQLVFIVALLIVTDVTRAFVIRRDAQLEKFKLDATGGLAQTEWFLKDNRDAYKIGGQYRLGLLGWGDVNTNRYLLNDDYGAGVYSASGGRDSAAVLKSYDDYLKTAEKNPHLLELANINAADNYLPRVESEKKHLSEKYLPRAFLVNCYVLAENDAAILNHLADPLFTGETFVYLNNDAAATLGEVTGSCDPYRPVMVDQKTDFIDFGIVKTDRPAILFISDNWYPGWNAYINGNKTAVVKANYTFKAVVLPAGENVVNMKFEPQSIPKGALITWVSLLVSAVYVIFKRNSR